METRMPATKDEIAELFWRHVEHYGFAKTSVGEVAAELGISKTTVYQYFSSKDDMLRYVIQNAAKEEADQVEREYAALPTYWDRFEKLVRERVLQSTRDWLDRYQDTEAKNQFEFGARVYGEVYDTLVQRWADEGAKAGEFHLVQGDLLLTARFIGSVLQFAIARTRVDRERDIDDAVVEAVRKQLA
jgi:AcrR family transcriptional regulator